MELTLLLSVNNIMSHIITQDLKIFSQKWYTLFSLLSLNFDSYCKNGLPLLHKVVLHYKIIPACNIWHIFIFSGATEHLEAIKPFGSLVASFKSLLYPTDFRIFWLKDRKMKAWLFKNRLKKQFNGPFFSAKPLPLQLQEIIVLSILYQFSTHLL
jgi:hypothetical protein